MPHEGEKKIEQLLREHAERRRAEAGTPLELHPANRRILQGEVTRQYPKTAAARPWHHFMTRLWPRFSFGVTTLAILGVVGWAVVSVWNELPGVGDATVREAKVAAADRERKSRKETEWTAASEAKKSVEDSDRFALTADGLEPLKDAPQPTGGRNRSPFDIVQDGEAAKTAPAKAAFPGNEEFSKLGVVSQNIPGAMSGRANRPSQTNMGLARGGSGSGGGAAFDNGVVSAAPVVKGLAVTETRSDVVTMRREAVTAGAAPAEKRFVGTATGPAQAQSQTYFVSPEPAKPSGGATLNDFIGKDQGADRKLDALYARTDKVTTTDGAVRRAPEDAASRSQTVTGAANAPADVKQEVALGLRLQNADAYFFESQDGTTETGTAAAARYSRLHAETINGAKAVLTKASEGTVLSTFEVRRDAQKIHIIDADGSAYEGQVVAAGLVEEDTKNLQKFKGVTAGEEKKLDEAEGLKRDYGVSLKAALTAPQSWSFRASGTNRTLNQLVTITGSMSENAWESSRPAVQLEKLGELSPDVSGKPATIPLAPSLPVAGSPGARGMIRADEPAAAQTPQLRAKVRVGTGPERDLKAVRVTR